MKNIYLDHNATTPMKPAVKKATAEAFDITGNASSTHGFGQSARMVVEAARRQIARGLNVDPEWVVFTGGATESNNTVLRSADHLNFDHLFVSGLEHPSIWDLGNELDKCEFIPATDTGIVDLDRLEKMLNGADGNILISVMMVNNETGVIQPMDAIVELAKQHNATVHVDAVQAVGRLRVDIENMGVDLVSVTAHKFGGPAGVGALIVRDDTPFYPMLIGGGQEKSKRAGTENVAGIVGMGLAMDLAIQDLKKYQRLEILRDTMEKNIISAVPSVIILGRDAPRVVNTSMMILPGLGSQTQLMKLDLAGVACSGGSACSSGRSEPSHVLRAMGVGDDLAGNALRVSLGWNTTQEDVAIFTEKYITMAQKLNRKAA